MIPVSSGGEDLCRVRIGFNSKPVRDLGHVETFIEQLLGFTQNVIPCFYLNFLKPTAENVKS